MGEGGTVTDSLLEKRLLGDIPSHDAVDLRGAFTGSLEVAFFLDDVAERQRVLDVVLHRLLRSGEGVASRTAVATCLRQAIFDLRITLATYFASSAYGLGVPSITPRNPASFLRSIFSRSIGTAL